MESDISVSHTAFDIPDKESDIAGFELTLPTVEITVTYVVSVPVLVDETMVMEIAERVICLDAEGDLSTSERVPDLADEKKKTMSNAVEEAERVAYQILYSGG